jgi:hypothetical protein
LGFGGGQNFYTYVGNAPTGFVDPSGMQIICPSFLPWCNYHELRKPMPPTEYLTDCVKKILAAYFPGLNLDTIALYPELPAFTGLAPIDVGAITWNNTVYYQPGYFDGSAAGIAALGHEVTHVRQQTGGLGSFLGGYLGSYLGNVAHGQGLSGSYENIAAEREAQAMEGKIAGDLLGKYGRKDPCDKPCEAKK